MPSARSFYHPSPSATPPPPTPSTAAIAAAAATAHGLEDARLGAGAATALLTGLLVIRDALDVLGQTFLFAHLLEAPEHLFGGLIAARLHFDHERDPFERTL